MRQMWKSAIKLNCDKGTVLKHYRVPIGQYILNEGMG